MTHTPTPWQLGHIMTTTNGRIWRDIYIPGGHIARVYLDSGNGQKAQEANAEHIVHCVNSHDALVAALRGVLAAGYYNDDGDFVIPHAGWDGKSDPPDTSDNKALVDACSALAALDKTEA